jgi:hypothetical protein
MPFLGRGKVLTRFRNYNIALFALAFFLMLAALVLVFLNIIGQVSANFVTRHAVSSANTFSTHIANQIELVARTAQSSELIAWLSDEDNDEKKLLAYEVLSGIMEELYSRNLYISFEGSLHEYRIERDISVDSIHPSDRLDKNNPEDAWYFDCIASGEDYTISVGIDRMTQRKRVWLNYKIVNDGLTLGVISTGLEFPHIARELFFALYLFRYARFRYRQKWFYTYRQLVAWR